MAVFFRILFAVIFIGKNVRAIENYCSTNTFNSNETSMQLTKEATYQEFAIVGKFKGLHCCAKGYRSIEWLKDGKPYPWAQDVSQMILLPESANQTIYTQKITKDDAGNYTCRLTNDAKIIEHVVSLAVFAARETPDDPKVTYISKNTEVALGENMRLFCEAFAETVDLPDAKNDAVWRKRAQNGTLYDIKDHLKQEKVDREDGETFGTYLVFPEVKKEDFGNFVCVVSKPGTTIHLTVSVREKAKVVEYINPNPFPLFEMIFFSTVILITAAAVVFLYMQFGLKMQVRLKDSFSHLEENDGKANDVLILYSPKDTEIALGVLLAVLENRYQYKCASRELPMNISQWYSDLQNAVNKSRRVVALLSPSTLNGQWNSVAIHEALKQLKGLSSKLTCVVLKALPENGNEVKNSQGETLISLAKMTNVVLWERSKDEKFWLSLRLRLPPKRGTVTYSSAQDGNETRLNNDSEESLSNLV